MYIASYLLNSESETPQDLTEGVSNQMKTSETHKETAAVKILMMMEIMLVGLHLTCIGCGITRTWSPEAHEQDPAEWRLCLRFPFPMSNALTGFHLLSGA